MTTQAHEAITAVEPSTPDARRTDTRERILEAAAELFADRGYAGTSIRDIADRLGLTKAALYYHFTSKDEILQALVAKPIALMTAVLDEPHEMTTPASLRAFIRSVLDAMAQCSPATVAVFKDPQLQRQVDSEVASSGVTDVMAIALAMGISGVDDPAALDRALLMRAVGAVRAGEAMLSAWHLLYPEEECLTEEAFAQITEVVARAVEA